tara:strand:+ start:632 stop:1015 length:384 start_codon:yes stop_codon:yes gene_type:complete
MNKNIKLRCKNCGYNETLENVTQSMNTKILIAQVPRIRKKDGLDIYPLLCQKCNYVTEWASDPFNVSKKAVDGVEYFRKFKLNKKYEAYFKPYKEDLVNRHYTNTEKIKYSIIWMIILAVLYSFFKS